ncbi:MAG: TIM barrel protein [Pseudomonadota bacterium]
MSIHLYKSAWGLVGAGCRYLSLSSFVASAHEEHYRGVEFPVFLLDNEPDGPDHAADALTEQLADLDLRYIALIATRPESWGDYDQHLASFRSQCRQAAQLGARKASVHAGADSFGIERGQRFLAECASIANDHGVSPCFETHRARILYNPFTCATLLERMPELALTSDLSHWLLVVDRMPHDIMDLFDLASARTQHLHARVGHEKSPQVTEPADPAWTEHVALYRRWWQISVDARAAAGDVLSVSPEFGPPPYMHAEPFTGEPSADIAAVNRWMREQLDDWFNGETPQ